MEATVYNLAGEEAGKIELDDTIFGITPNMAVVHQAVLRQQANARQGTHNTKTRAHVSGGGRKPWRQKGTGRARQGSTRSPQFRHGGVVFGPHTRSYEQDMPRKMRRLAIRSVLSSKATDGRIVVVDGFEEMEPRTKVMIELLKKLNIGTESALIFTSSEEGGLAKAAGNIPNVRMISAHLLSVVDMLKHNYIIMPRASVDIVTGILGNTGGRRKFTLRGSTAEAAQTAPVVEEAEAVKAEKPARKPRASAKAAAAEDENVALAPSAEQQDAAEATIEPETSGEEGEA